MKLTPIELGGMLRTAIFFLLVTMALCPSQHAFAQQEAKDRERIPPEQLPIAERETGDSFGETLGELPGKIVTFPLKLVFKGASAVAGFMDYHQVVLRLTDFLTNEDGTRKVRPVFAPFAGGGFTFKQNGLWNPTTQFRASATFGIRTRRTVAAQLRDPKFFTPHLGWQLRMAHIRLPDEDFFGIGNGSVAGNRTDYLHEENRYFFELLAEPLRRTYLSAGIGISDVSIRGGRDPNTPNLDSLFTPVDVPGFSGADMWSIHVQMYHDSRNATGHPTRGGEFYFGYEYSREINGQEFGYSKFTFDYRQHIELFYRRVLAVRLRSEITDNIGQREVPFYRLGGLGGTDILRGYRPSRFRDKDLLLASIEYRWPVHTFIVVYGFFEQGRVFADIFDEFTLHDFKYSAGGGFRFSGRDGGLVAVLEVAKSKEQLRFNFGINTDLRRF